jgi:FkbM family methyltransferase
MLKSSLKRYIKKINSKFAFRNITAFDADADMISTLPKHIKYTINQENNTIFFKEVQLELNIKQDVQMIKGIEFIHTLVKQVGAAFYKRGTVVYCNVNGLRVKVTTWEELLILNEIFIKGVYDLRLHHEFILIDIGVNVGFTSLFFALKRNCVNVYGFEPFKKTFEQAKYNFNLNTELSNKIYCYNYGLGGSNEDVEAEYNVEYKGSMGINGVPVYIPIEDIEKIKINIREATPSLQPIFEQHPGELVIMKVDCEGSEYDIIESLYMSKVLSKIDVLMIEWHIKGASFIIDYLNKSGFISIPVDEQTDDYIGMIYAFRVNPKEVFLSGMV